MRASLQQAAVVTAQKILAVLNRRWLSHDAARLLLSTTLIPAPFSVAMGSKYSTGNRASREGNARKNSAGIHSRRSVKLFAESRKLVRSSQSIFRFDSPPSVYLFSPPESSLLTGKSFRCNFYRCNSGSLVFVALFPDLAATVEITSHFVT